MAITYIAGSINNSTSSTDSAQATINDVSAGNSLLFFMEWRTESVSGISSITISGSENNASLRTATAPIGPGNSCHQWAYLSDVQNGGNKTIDLTMTGAPAHGWFCAWELSGCDTSDANFIDAETTAEGASTELKTTIDTNTDNCALFAAYSNDNDTHNAPTGWTDIAVNDMWWYSDAAYNVDVGSSGTIDVDPTHASNPDPSPGDWGISVVATKAAGGGGGGSSLLPQMMQHGRFVGPPLKGPRARGRTWAQRKSGIYVPRRLAAA